MYTQKKMSLLHILKHSGKLENPVAVLQEYVELNVYQQRFQLNFSVVQYMFDHPDMLLCSSLFSVLQTLQRNKVQIEFYIDVPLHTTDTTYFMQLIQHNLLTAFTTQLCHHLIKYPFVFSLLLRCKCELTTLQIGLMFIHVHQRPTLGCTFYKILEQNVHLSDELEDRWLQGYLWYLTTTIRCLPRPVSYASIFAQQTRVLRETIQQSLGLHTGLDTFVNTFLLL
jgi:hypothetical protein